MTGFDDVRAPKKGPECPRCGERATAGNVLVLLREAKRNGGRAQDVRSKTATFCEPCAVEVFIGLRDALLEAKKA